MDKINYVKNLLQSSKNIVFMTGAGVSTHSGIPDYRSSNGLYSENPEYMLSDECWEKEYDKFMGFIKDKFINILDCEPNDIHRWISSFKNSVVITQNIDGLHQKAGSPIEPLSNETLDNSYTIPYHGDINKWTCVNCGVEYDLKSLNIDTYCVCCKGKLKPEVVLYGQGIDDLNHYNAVEAVINADLIVVVGTSLKVFPFAGLLSYVDLNKTKVILINNEDTENYSQIYDAKLIGDALKTIEELREE